MASDNSIKMQPHKEAEIILKKMLQEQEYRNTHYSIPDNEKITYQNITYGQLVQVYIPGGRIASVKVHFFNKSGVLVGNIYEFVPYNRLRLHGKGKIFERKFYKRRFEFFRQKAYELACMATSILIRLTQSIK